MRLVLLLVLVPVIMLAFYSLVGYSTDFSSRFGGAQNVSSFLIVLLTYVYVVITGMMVRQMVASQREERRPYVVADLDFKKHAIFVVLKNIGKLPAKSVKVSFQPELPAAEGIRLSETIFRIPLAFFPPGKEFRAFVNIGPDFLRDENPKEFQVSLSYAWSGNKAGVQERYAINVDFYKNFRYLSEKDLGDVCKEMKRMSDTIRANAGN